MIIITAKYKELLRSRPDKDYSGLDQEQLAKGIKVEKEHTKDLDVSEEEKEKIAKEIASDHLEEANDFKDEKGGKYYDRLEKMEKDMKIIETSKYQELVKEAKKKEKYNPYSICTVSIGKTEGTQERGKWSEEAEDRYVKCKKAIEKQNKGEKPKKSKKSKD